MKLFSFPQKIIHLIIHEISHHIIRKLMGYKQCSFVAVIAKEGVSVYALLSVK